MNPPIVNYQKNVFVGEASILEVNLSNQIEGKIILNGKTYPIINGKSLIPLKTNRKGTYNFLGYIEIKNKEKIQILVEYVVRKQKNEVNQPIQVPRSE